MRRRESAGRRGRAWRPSRNQWRIAVFVVAMLTVIYAGSVPRRR
ncbi:hypothetical protein [Streptomyces longwoodensis]